MNEIKTKEEICNEAFGQQPHFIDQLSFTEGFMSAYHLPAPKLNYSKVMDRIDQCHCANIEKIYWIVASFENSDLKEILCEMSEKEFDKCFPGILTSKSHYLCRNDQDEIMQVLSDYNFHGLFAVIHHPEHNHFTFKDDKFQSCSISMGICRVGYVYAETLDELLTKIEDQSEEMFQGWIEEFKSLELKKKQVPKSK